MNLVNLTYRSTVTALALTTFCRTSVMTSANRNLALNKPAKQSSTFRLHGTPLPADLAVDGVDSEEAENCSHTTSPAATHWWFVDLGGVHSINSIGIRNRRSGSWKLSNFTVQVSNQEPTSLAGFPGTTTASLCIEINSPVPKGSIITYNCELPVTGRYVFVVKPSADQEPLSICEFEVYKKMLLLRRFAYIIHQGEEQALTTTQARRYITDCARLHVKIARTSFPYTCIQIDLPSGFCRFLKNCTESQNSLSYNWVVYKLE